MADNNDKGKLLEEIVVSLHLQDSYKVEKNKFFKPLNENKKKREIDVLLSKTLAGSKVYIPIECKNHKKKVGANEIDAFYGKLYYLGLDVKKSIFISVSDYTSGAKDNASYFGIKLLTFKGLSEDRMSLLLLNAIQSFSYILPILKSYSIVNSISSSVNNEHLVFYDSKKNLRGTLADIIYEFWMTNKISSQLGLQKLNVSNANELYCLQENNLEQCISIEFEVLIVCCIVNFKGLMTKKILLEDENIDKLKINANFKEKKNYTYIFFDNEQFLADYKKNRDEYLKIDFRKVKLPKVRINKLFYPLNKKVLKEIDDFSSYKDEEIFNQKIETIEKDFFNSMWEPV